MIYKNTQLSYIIDIRRVYQFYKLKHIRTFPIIFVCSNQILHHTCKTTCKTKRVRIMFFMFRLFFRMIRHTVFTKPPSLALGHKKLHKRFTAKRKCATPFRDGSRISGKGVHMYKGVCGVALLLLSHFS